MTDQPPSSADEGDSRLMEKLAQLQGIEPTPSTKAAFHKLVATKLIANRHLHSVRWWRRSVRVPVPVCVAVGLTICALLFSRLPSTAEHPSSVPIAPPMIPAMTAEPTLRTTTTYMLGVGALATETRYLSQEDRR
ncbi:MAG TPA: hypothetical protein VGN12_26065 [Pirellulales bacterium]